MIVSRCFQVILLLALAGCGPTRPEDFPPFPVEIDAARDTILHTPNGALIHISPHAWQPATPAWSNSCAHLPGTMKN